MKKEIITKKAPIAEHILSQAIVSGEQRNIAGADTIEEAKTSDGHQFYKITVKKWALFGSFDGKPPKKYDLE